jgi:hypothetical protein
MLTTTVMELTGARDELWKHVRRFEVGTILESLDPSVLVCIHQWVNCHRINMQPSRNRSGKFFSGIQIPPYINQIDNLRQVRQKVLNYEFTVHLCEP